MNPKDLSLLFSRTHSTQRSVLSVYLNVDQSQQANLNAGFEARLKKMATTVKRTIIDVAERERFVQAVRHVQDFVSAYSPRAKALVLFFDTTDGFFWHEDADFPVSDQLRWEFELVLQPLANAMDQLESYVVVLADRSKSRFFLVSLGKIQEVLHQDSGKRRVRHIKTAGTDHMDSSSRIQRKADNQIRANLQKVKDAMSDIARTEKVHRFVLAGTPETVSELRGLLPARLKLAVIGEVVIGSNASPSEVLSGTRAVVEKFESDTEVDKVNRIVTSAAKKGEAVVGLGSTLKAVNSGRVWELIYAGDLIQPGFECPKCAALFSARPTRCTYCNARLYAVNNVVERAVEHALRSRAKIEVVTGNASVALKEAGGIGAFLKTRTGSLQAS